MFTTILLLVIGFSILTISLSAAGIIPMTMAASVTYSVFLIVVTLIQFLAHKYLKIRNKKTVKKTLDERDKVIAELSENQFYLMEFVAQLLGSHDLFTGRHVIHTQTYVEMIAHKLRELGYYTEELSDSTINNMKAAAFLHDIGKIHIPEGILNKNGKFTQEEFELMRCHPEEGAKLIDFLPLIDDGRFNKIAEEMTLCHHEKWDGTGYPYHLKGTDIPLSARIMAAADVLDALLSRRLYKSPIPIEEAMDVFKKSSGAHFEPCIVEAVLAIQSLIDESDHNFKETEAATNEEELACWDNYHEMIERAGK